MLDPFFLWLESTAFSTWTRESTSVFAFPTFLAAHTIGLGFLVGLSAALDLRLLGAAPGVPVTAWKRYAPLMWMGLWMNVVSGAVLLVAYPTKALTNPVFYVKLGLIGVALWLLRVTLRHVAGDPSAMLTPARLRLVAIASLVCWAGGILAGRLLAYTYTRLLASW